MFRRALVNVGITAVLVAGVLVCTFLMLSFGARMPASGFDSVSITSP